MKKTTKYSIGLALLAALLFIPFLGGVHLFDWDEVNFAEISREMLLTGDYFRVYVNFQPFWEKPPMFFWMQAGSMSVFGINEFSARFPNAVCGMLTLPLLFLIGNKLRDVKFGLLWAASYLGSILPFLYFKSGIIDPWFNLFIFLGLYLFVLSFWKKDAGFTIPLKRSNWFYLIAGGLILGLAVITKGPVALLVITITLSVYWIMKRFRFFVKPWHFLVYLLATVVVIFSWFGLEYLQNGPWFIREFVRYQYRLFSTPDAGHAGFPGYHFVVLFIGVFPASIFVIRSFFKMPKEDTAHMQDFTLWMKIMFWVVLILFSIVKSKIVHYSSLAYFPMSFLSALVLYQIITGRIRMNNFIKTGLWIIGILLFLAALFIPIAGNNIEIVRPLFSKDRFATANLQADVDWGWVQFIPAAVMLGILLTALPLLSKGNYRKGLISLFAGMALFMTATIYCFTSKIEAYSQRAAVEFAESLQGKRAYLITEGYKSYVPYFYTRKEPVTDKRSYNRDWLYYGEVDRPVYIITKVDKLHLMEPLTQFEKIGEKNGFVFYRRK